MINRLKVSVFKPSLIGCYANDKIWRLFVYALLMIVFLILPNIMSIATFNGVSSDTFNSIQDQLRSEIDSIPVSVIVDGKLLIKEEDKTIVKVNQYQIGFGKMPLVGFFLDTDSFSVVSMGMIGASYSYQKLGIENLDIKLAIRGIDNQGMDLIKGAINTMLLDSKPIWGTVEILLYLAIYLFSYVGGCFLFALLLKLTFGDLKYREVFTVVLYGFTVAVFGYTLGTLYNLYIIDILCSVVSVFFIWRAMRVLAINRMIQKNIMK